MGTFGAEPSNREDMAVGKVHYEIKRLNQNRYKLSVKVCDYEWKKNIVLKLDSLLENTATELNLDKLTTVGRVWETFKKEFSYSRKNIKVRTLTIRVYKDTFAKKGIKIGEAQIDIRQNAPDKGIVILEKMAKPKLQPNSGPEDSDSEPYIPSEHINRHEDESLDNDPETEKAKEVESRLCLMEERDEKKDKEIKELKDLFENVIQPSSSKKTEKINNKGTLCRNQI